MWKSEDKNIRYLWVVVGKFLITVEKAQHVPAAPWSLTGVTASCVLQSKLSGSSAFGLVFGNSLFLFKNKIYYLFLDL